MHSGIPDSGTNDQLQDKEKLYQVRCCSELIFPAQAQTRNLRAAIFSAVTHDHDNAGNILRCWNVHLLTCTLSPTRRSSWRSSRGKRRGRRRCWSSPRSARPSRTSPRSSGTRSAPPPPSFRRLVWGFVVACSGTRHVCNRRRARTAAHKCRGGETPSPPAFPHQRPMIGASDYRIAHVCWVSSL